MALWNSRDFLSSKYTTAIIMDKGNRAYSVAIKNTIDDYFPVTISKQRYIFKLEGQRIMTWRQKGRKTHRFLLYTTDNYHPMSPSQNKELEMIIIENSLPKKMDNKLYALFDLLAKREKKIDKEKPFENHDLEEVLESVSKDPNFPEVAENMKNFFERLNTKQIITPVKSVSEFLTDELKTTDATIFGVLENQVKRTEKEQRAMSNTVTDAKKNWLVIGILGLLVGGGAIFIIYAASTGAFDHIIPQIGPPTPTSGPPKNLNDFATKYPTCEKLQSAIDSGEIKLADVPQAGKDMLKTCKVGIVATPIK